MFNTENYQYLKFIEKYPHLEPLFEDILKQCESKLIILFGSYAKNLAKKESDIDIYIETNSPELKRKISEINSKLSIKIGKFDTTSLLIKEIIKEHIIIRGVEEYYEKNGFFN